jgi:hypothetical protein
MSAISLIRPAQAAAASPAKYEGTTVTLSTGDDLRTAIAGSAAGTRFILSPGIHDVSDPRTPIVIARGRFYLEGYAATLVVPAGIQVAAGGSITVRNVTIESSTAHTVTISAGGDFELVGGTISLVSTNAALLALNMTGGAVQLANAVVERSDSAGAASFSIISPAASITGGDLTTRGTVTFHGANALGSVSSGWAADGLPTLIIGHPDSITCGATVRVEGPVEFNGDSLTPARYTFERMVVLMGYGRDRCGINLVNGGDTSASFRNNIISIAELFIAQHSGGATGAYVADAVHVSTARVGDGSRGAEADTVMNSGGTQVNIGNAYLMGALDADGAWPAFTNALNLSPNSSYRLPV